MPSLTSSQFSALSYDDIVRLGSSGGEVALHVSDPLPHDPMRVGLLLACMSRHDGTLTVTFQHTPVTSPIALSLKRSMLGPLLWGSNSPKAITIPTANLARADLAVTDPESRLVCVHSSKLDPTNPDDFQADLVDYLRASRLPLGGFILGALTTVAFEASSNAEEYSPFYTPSDSADVFRFVALQRHESPTRLLAPLAQDYFASYHAAGHADTAGWLELTVVDAGMGIAYPSYYLLPEQLRGPNRDVYQANPVEESTRLQLVLDEITSTKGAWGRVLNRHTAVGQGTRYIKFRLAAVRGFASVRTGRFSAQWSYPRVEISSRDVAQLPMYTVSSQATSLFVGTAWQVLIPLNTQLALGV